MKPPNATTDAKAARVHATVEARRQLYARAVHVDEHGNVSLAMTPDDWEWHEPRADLDEATAQFNSGIAAEINAGHVGSELLRRCVERRDALGQFGDFEGPSIAVLCELLIRVKGDHEYQMWGRHFADWDAGWRQVGTVDASQGFVWIGDPDDAPLPPISPPRRQAAALQRHARGIAMHVWGDSLRRPLRVDGLYPGRANTLAAVRVVLSHR